MRGCRTLLAALALMTCACGPSPPGAEARPAPAETDSEPAGPTTTPAAFSERLDERLALVREHIASPEYGPPVRDTRVLEAMRRVPRHAFVPWLRRSSAYVDTPLPIGHGQTISQPYIVAFMTELLELRAGQKVLEIGTGSAYQAAVLAELTDEVYTIEIVKPLATRARKLLTDLGYTRVRTRQADGYHGWPEAGPFDAVIVTCAAGHVPPPLWEQLKPGGRMVVPVGGVYEVQQLVLLTKKPDGTRESRAIMPVRFVPLTRASE